MAEAENSGLVKKDEEKVEKEQTDEEKIEEALSEEKMLESQMKGKMKKLGIENGKLDGIVEDIHVTGYAKVTIRVTPKVDIILKTLTGEEVSEINKKLGEMEGTMIYIQGEQGLNILSYSLLSINGKSIGSNPKERREYLLKQGEIFLNTYVVRYNDLRELIQMSVQGEPVKKF